MSKTYTFLFLLLSWCSLYSQEDFVVLDQATQIEITSKTKLVKTFSERVLVQNNKSSFDEIVLPYRMGEKINSLSVKIYDINGEMIENVKQKDFNDFTYLTSNLYDDLRKKEYEIDVVPPFILEWEYQIELNNIVNLPTWYPQTNNDVEVKQATLDFTIPITWSLEAKFQYILPKMDTIQDASKRTFSFEIADISTFEKGNYTGDMSDCLPKIFFRTNNFISDKYDGSNQSWKDFGQFYYSLNKDKTELPEDLANYVIKMKQQYSNEKILVSKMYRDMQQSKRYESVQIGIGGFESFHVADVFENGYGDCKALSNYMRAVLIAADIETYSVLINSGNIVEDIDTSFVCSQFNHVIQCAIVDGDTIWLECTSNSLPAGYLGGFTSNRTGLLVKNNESILVKTPAYDKSVTHINRQIDIVVDADGSAILQVKENLSGVAQDQLRAIFMDYSESTQKKYLENYYLRYKNFTLTSFTLDTISKTTPFLEFQYILSISNFVKKTSNRLFIKMGALPNHFPVFESAIDDEKFPLVYRESHSSIDSINIHLPYDLVNKNSDKSITDDYFNYNVSWDVKEGNVSINREYKIDNFYTDDRVLIDSLVKISSDILQFNNSDILLKIID